MNLTVLSSVSASTDFGRAVTERDPAEREGTAFGEVFGALVAAPRTGAATGDAQDAMLAPDTRQAKDPGMGAGDMPIPDAGAEIETGAIIPSTAREVGTIATRPALPVNATRPDAQSIKGDATDSDAMADTAGRNTVAGPAGKDALFEAPAETIAMPPLSRAGHQDRAHPFNSAGAKVTLATKPGRPFATGEAESAAMPPRNGQGTSAKNLAETAFLRTSEPAQVDRIQRPADTTGQAIHGQTPGVQVRTVERVLNDPWAGTDAPDSPTKDIAEDIELTERRSSASDTPAIQTDRSGVPASLTTLERHLGRHAATLMPETGVTRHRAPSTSGWTPSETVPETPMPVLTAAPDPAHAGTSTLSKNRTPGMGMVSIRPVAGPAAYGQDHKVPDPDDAVTRSADDIGFDFRSQFHITSTTPTAHAPRNDMAAHVARQVADAVSRSSDSSVELTLNPVELGRVRMVLSATDAGITVNILAERPETLDLLRRNIDDLGKSFADMGYEDISFSFGHGDQTTDDTGGDTEHAAARGPADLSTQHTTTPSTRHVPQPAIASNGIDMRL